MYGHMTCGGVRLNVFSPSACKLLTLALGGIKQVLPTSLVPPSVETDHHCLNIISSAPRSQYGCKHEYDFRTSGVVHVLRHSDLISALCGCKNGSKLCFNRPLNIH